MGLKEKGPGLAEQECHWKETFQKRSDMDTRNPGL